MAVPAPRAPPEPGTGRSSDRPTVGACTVDVSAGAACHVRSNRPGERAMHGTIAPLHAQACAARTRARARRAARRTRRPRRPRPRPRGGAWIPGGGGGGAGGPRRGSRSPLAGGEIRVHGGHQREEELVRVLLPVPRCSGTCRHHACRNSEGTIGSSDPEYASETNSSSSHARQYSSSRSGSTPRATAAATRRARSEAHRYLLCPSARKKPPTVGARIVACNTVERKHVLPKLAIPRTPRGTPAELTLGSVASPGTRGGGFESRAAIRVAILRRFSSETSWFSPEGSTRAATARMPNTARSKSREYTWTPQGAQKSSARSTSANTECASSARACAIASSFVHSRAQPRHTCTGLV